MVFTKHEAQTIRMIQQGLSFSQMAHELGKHESGIKQRVNRIARKLGIVRGPLMIQIAALTLLPLDHPWRASIEKRNCLPQ